jgi:hypothetical protein
MAMIKRIVFLTIFWIVVVSCCSGIAGCSFYFFQETSSKRAAQISGVLRVHPTNPRYFIDDSGRAIYLSGHQMFFDLQDRKAATYGGQIGIDWKWYLQFLTDRNLNYIRNWTTFAFTASPAGVDPLPYRRVNGYGYANDGGLKFDLNQFNPVFFDRMRSRAIDLGNRGIIISYMLFDVYGFESRKNPGVGLNQVFNEGNNINGVDAKDLSFFFSPSPEVMRLQKAYVNKVIDTVGDLDNVFFEVANEMGAISWQLEMINHIKTYEARSKKHLILYSPAGLLEDGANYHSSSIAEALTSGASVFSVAGGWADYVNDPPVNTWGMPAIIDIDHIFWREYSVEENIRIPWKAFTRGYHYALYDAPFEVPETETAEWDMKRRGAGGTVTYANKIDLANMEPSTVVSSTRFALAKAGSEYLVYAPGGGSFTVDVQAGTYDYEWFNTRTAAIVSTGPITTLGRSHSFTPPFDGDAVLYLRVRREWSPNGGILPQALYIERNKSAPASSHHK